MATAIILWAGFFSVRYYHNNQFWNGQSEKMNTFYQYAKKFTNQEKLVGSRLIWYADQTVLLLPQDIKTLTYCYDIANFN